MSQAEAGTYVYDQEWREERDRLRGMEGLWDPGTQAHMESIGVSAGWRCLEVGAGAGGIVEWMADRVGDEGEVVATDISVKYLSAIERPNLEVLEHDILQDPLPDASFDLAHSRMVVEHLGRPALERIAAAVKPGGTILIEDLDFGGAGVHPENEGFLRVQEAVLDFMSQAGFDPHYGRALVPELRSLGFEDIRAEGRVRVYPGGHPGTAFARLSLLSLGPTLVEAGKLEQHEIGDALAGLDDPANVYLSPTLVAARGRRPPEQ